MTGGTKRRLIFDCNVFLQALLNAAGPSGRCLDIIATHQAVLLLSDAIVREVRHVMRNPAISARFSRLTAERVQTFLDEIRYLGEEWPDVRPVSRMVRDPKDTIYVDLADAARADFIITRDADLLDLPTGHDLDARQFRQLTQNRTRVVTPVEFLQLQQS